MIGDHLNEVGYEKCRHHKVESKFPPVLGLNSLKEVAFSLFDLLLLGRTEDLIRVIGDSDLLFLVSFIIWIIFVVFQIRVRIVGVPRLIMARVCLFFRFLIEVFMPQSFFVIIASNFHRDD